MEDGIRTFRIAHSKICCAQVLDAWKSVGGCRKIEMASGPSGELKRYPSMSTVGSPPANGYSFFAKANIVKTV